MTANFRIEHTLDLEQRDHSIWQFKEYFAEVDPENIVSMGEGWTPLVTANRYAGKIGMENDTIFCKMETLNPTGSFKDRPASLSVSLARQWKKAGIFLASSGNAAASTAAYCARAGMPCLVLFREDSSVSKLSQIAMYEPSLLRVKGLYNDVESLTRSFELTQKALPKWHNGFIWAKYNPLILDSLKTIAYEITAAKCLPDYVFVPTAGGDLLFGIFKGYQELKSAGQIKKIPKIVAVQGTGSSPTVDALKGRTRREQDEDTSPTIAAALRSTMISEHAVEAVRRSGGFGIDVSNSEIASAQREVSRFDGIFCELSSATTFAALRKAVGIGKISRSDIVCPIVTGSGFKDYTPPFSSVSEVSYADSPELIETVLSKMNLR